MTKPHPKSPWSSARRIVVKIGSALLVVTMRDIIRCGLAMVVCFGALAGLYVLLCWPLSFASQSLEARLAVSTRRTPA